MRTRAADAADAEFRLVSIGGWQPWFRQPMPDALPVDEFLRRSGGAVIVDLRTPDEFAKGHIPGAVNVPLFSNDERAEIGTAYKQEGRRPAVSLGLRRLGPRMEALAGELLALCDGGAKPLHLHCWRGGMRSGSVAWLMESAYDCRVAVLKGGYKWFRRWVLASFSLPRKVRVVSGLTGSGKTEVLGELAAQGQNVVDLERLANHKGSAFGHLGEEPQPPQAQFENDLALAWRATDPDRPVWLEDESRMVGKRVIPMELWTMKCGGHFDVITIPETNRVAWLCEVYGGFPPAELEARVGAIAKRLGGARAAEVLAAIRNDDMETACRGILFYYDRTYLKSISAVAPERATHHSFEHSDPREIARALIQSLPATT